MLDLGAIDDRHDEAVLVGRKLNTDPLDDEDLIKLFASCSDIPALLAELARVQTRLTEAEAVISRAQDALGADDPVFWILDDYDGTMDSVKAMQGVVEAVRAWRAMVEEMGAVEAYSRPREVNLISVVDEYERGLGRTQ